MNLEDVYRKYQALGLGGKNGTSEKFVPGDGPCPSKFMIIGEAPGADEDSIGKPFQGASGRVLNQLLGFAHVRREDVFVTNVFKYRPPENRTPFPNEVIKSIPCLSDEIKCVDPRVILLCGRVACQSFFPGRPARSLRGQITEKGGRYIIVTYHPAVLLYTPDRRDPRPLMQADFALAAKLSKKPD